VIGSSRTISLFTEQPQASGKPYAFLLSAVMHVTVAGVVVYGFLFAPRINMRAAADRYVVRRVDLNRPDPENQRTAGDSSLYPKLRSVTHTPSPLGRAAAPSSSRRQLADRMLAVQTVVQPDAPLKKLVMKDTPLPAVMLWSAPTPKVQVITPPPPHPATTAEVRPAIIQPNHEVAPADIAISSTAFTSAIPMPMPSTSSPVVVRGPDPTKRVPETSSTTSNQPTSAAVVSLSDLRMAKGTVALPPINETAPGSQSGALAPGRAGNASQPGDGDPSSKGTETGARQSQGDPGNSTGTAASQRGVNSGNAASSSGSTARGEGGQSSEVTYTKITLPQNGQFGVVVVGSTLQEQYPETAGLWKGRLVYSVYLHVGLAKNWILQYSLPSSTDAAAAGSVNRLEAPWPYYIVRPNLNPADADVDALMIHGFVDESGHFQSLTFSLPSGFAQARPILDALQQWQFRPAKENGKLTKVEVLLIIPEDED
jgi:hypothetical protein